MNTDTTRPYTRRPRTIERFDVGLVVPLGGVGVVGLAGNEAVGAGELEPHDARVFAAELIEYADHADRIRDEHEAGT